MNKALLYVADVYEAFRDQPGKFDEFMRITGFAFAHKITEAHTISMMTQLMEGNTRLLLGFRALLTEATIAVPDVVERPEKDLLEPQEHNFLNNVKTRFATLDTYVYVSVLWKLKMYKVGKKSLQKMQEEVLDLLYYHEDLTEEFSKLY